MRLVKVLLITAFVLLMLGLAGCSSGPKPENEAQGRVTFDDVKNEPPMTEDEIVRFIEILPSFAPLEGGADPKAEMEFYRKNSITKNRFFYLRSKTAFASLISAGRPPDLSSVPQALHPNDNEISLIDKHYEALKEAADTFNDSVRSR